MHSDLYYWHTGTVECVTPLGPPTTKMFTRKLTHLTILTTVRPADAETQSDMNRQREQFLNRHIGHDKAQRYHTKNYFEENYLVSNNDYTFLPKIFRPSLYRIFAFLGFSMPYRWILFFSIGHVRYKIEKYAGVLPDSGQSQTPYLLSWRHFQLSSLQTTEMNHSVSVSDQLPCYDTVVNASVK